MRRSSFLLLFIGFVSAASAQTVLVKNLQVGRPQTVVAYGTSLTAGGAWVKQVGEALDQAYPDKVTVVNSGGSGQYSAWGVKNLDTHVLQKKPDLLFIEFSINDSVARFNCSVEQARDNLENMIRRTKQALPGCEIMLMTMTRGDKYPEGHRSHRKNIEAYYEMVRTAAKALGLDLLDHDSNWRSLRERDPARFKEYVPDTIHPTAAGNAAVVTPVILKALGLPEASDTTILALGDSITQGGKSFSCYRAFLLPALEKQGLHVSFIGPNKDATSAHAGFGGNNTKVLLGKVSAIYQKYPADIVLLHAGHNSFSKDQPVPGILKDTEAIIQTIHKANPQIQILLAQVITAGKLPKYYYIPELNAAMPELVARLKSKGIKVQLVDQASGFDWKTDTVADKVHPNASGAQKMADQWLRALVPIL